MEYMLPLNKNWLIQSCQNAPEAGSLISTTKYFPVNWHRAVVPSTVMGALVNDGVYKDIFNGDNLKNIPAKEFEKPWWYRTEFNLPGTANGKTIKLKFEGIIYRAEIWLNGKLVADSGTVQGVYRMFEFDVSAIVKKSGKNILAVKVFPPRRGEPSVGFVDWNPAPPDKNTGIWRNVSIMVSGDVSVNYPFVQSKVNTETLKSAELTLSAELLNNKNKNVSGILAGEIGQIKFSKKIELKPAEKKVITFSPADFPRLKINNPRLWWTYRLGKPELYKLKLNFIIKGKISDAKETSFGIREVSDYINEDGFRGYKLNGRKILILGGGWVDNLFLNGNSRNLKSQINYVKQMGLNAIRLEGIWGANNDLFDLCDKNGILVMTGWSCQWEWEDYIGKPADDFGAIKSSQEMELISNSFADQVKWLRNHPCIFVWLYGSDLTPRPELENKYQAILQNDDPSRPFLASAAEHISSVTGKTGVKMRGPYDYVPPFYWWSDKNKGGAFGFNTEVGPGAEVPPVESIKKMIPPGHLWPVDSIWNFHCGKNAFSNLKNYNDALFKRLGMPGSVEEYCTKAQYINYENTRAMFEAHEANKFSATGVIHWMLNSAWPKLWWQLYDFYLMPGGAFFGTMKACEPIHILYNYNSGEITAVNNTLLSQNSLTAKISVLNFDLSDMYSQNISLSLPADQAVNILQIPEISNLDKTYFLDLKLFNSDKIVSSNFYCLSTKQDVLDTAKATWMMTPVKEYADLTGLNKLEKVHLKVSSKFTGAGENDEVEVKLVNNTNKLAFQIVLSVAGGKTGEPVLPILWEDNYFSMLPGEERVIKGSFSKTDLKGKQPVLLVSGWNIN
ncbi:MAG: sugar-binding domain-containing protein [Ignavibacteriaceae bacterium]